MLSGDQEEDKRGKAHKGVPAEGFILIVVDLPWPKLAMLEARRRG